MGDDGTSPYAVSQGGPGVSQGDGDNKFREVEKRYQMHKDQVMKKR